MYRQSIGPIHLGEDKSTRRGPIDEDRETELAAANSSRLRPATFMLAACASQIMKSYVGVPISSVMLDYGPPDNLYEMRPGERAYQWRKDKVVSGSSSGEVRQTRRGERYEVTETPGHVERTEYFYTFYTRNSGGEWYVTSFRQPQLECE
jgi:hypothetical protein